MIVIVMMFLYIRGFDPSVEMGPAVASGETRGLSWDGPWCVERLRRGGPGSFIRRRWAALPFGPQRSPGGTRW